MKTTVTARAVLIVATLSTVKCGGNWREVREYTATLQCGMSVDDARKEAIARGAERFEVIRSREGYSQYVSGTSRTQVLLKFSETGLHQYEAVRFFGLTGAETLAEATLCSTAPQSLIDYKVEAPAEYAGADVLIGNSPVGRLAATSVPSPMAVGVFKAATGRRVVNIHKPGLPSVTRETNIAWDADWAFVDVRPCP